MIMVHGLFISANSISLHWLSWTRIMTSLICLCFHCCKLVLCQQNAFGSNSPCPTGWDYIPTENKCFTLPLNPLPAKLARTKCKVSVDYPRNNEKLTEQHVDLVTILNPQANKVVCQYARKVLRQGQRLPDFHIGLHDSVNQVYTWFHTGKRATYLNWAPNEPDDDDDIAIQNYSSMILQSCGWKDVNGNNWGYALCELIGANACKDGNGNCGDDMECVVTGPRMNKCRERTNTTDTTTIDSCDVKNGGCKNKTCVQISPTRIRCGVSKGKKTKQMDTGWVLPVVILLVIGGLAVATVVIFRCKKRKSESESDDTDDDTDDDDTSLMTETESGTSKATTTQHSTTGSEATKKATLDEEKDVISSVSTLNDAI